MLCDSCKYMILIAVIVTTAMLCVDLTFGFGFSKDGFIFGSIFGLYSAFVAMLIERKARISAALQSALVSALIVGGAILMRSIMPLFTPESGNSFVIATV